jgi:hypothetical protein
VGPQRRNKETHDADDAECSRNRSRDVKAEGNGPQENDWHKEHGAQLAGSRQCPTTLEFFGGIHAV